MGTAVFSISNVGLGTVVVGMIVAVGIAEGEGAFAAHALKRVQKTNAKNALFIKPPDLFNGPSLGSSRQLLCVEHVHGCCGHQRRAAYQRLFVEIELGMMMSIIEMA